MGKRTSLWILEKMHGLIAQGSFLEVYIDQDAHESVMRWIPPFRACRALTSVAAVATPSGTIGDWFHPDQIQSGWTLNTDYEIVKAGGLYVDMYPCSSWDASSTSKGTVAGDTAPNRQYVSQRGVAPRVSQPIAHFRQYLYNRFSGGGFAGSGSANWAGKGGLIPDQYWFEIWIWTRINRWLLHGNTNGYNSTENPKVPHWHLNPNEIGILDATEAANGGSITGGGPLEWDIPISDFCGNRWEFAEGLRLYNGVIYTAGKTIKPWSNPSDGYDNANFTNTNLTISGVTSGQSVASYRIESAIKLHGIAASTTTAGSGGFDGQGWWHDLSGERIARRGGNCGYGAQCPGALDLSYAPSGYAWSPGARAVLVP